VGGDSPTTFAFHSPHVVDSHISQHTTGVGLLSSPQFPGFSALLMRCRHTVLFSPHTLVLWDLPLYTTCECDYILVGSRDYCWSPRSSGCYTTHLSPHLYTHTPCMPHTAQLVQFYVTHTAHPLLDSSTDFTHLLFTHITPHTTLVLVNIGQWLVWSHTHIPVLLSVYYHTLLHTQMVVGCLHTHLCPWIPHDSRSPIRWIVVGSLDTQFGFTFTTHWVPHTTTQVFVSHTFDLHL